MNSKVTDPFVWAVMAVLLWALPALSVPELELDATLASDNFEDLDVVRTGNPEIVLADISPGLLQQTRQGVYRTDGSVDIVAKSALVMPDGDKGEYLTSAIRVYSFGRMKRRDGQLATIFTSGADNFRIGLRHLTDQADLVCAVEGGQKMSIPYLALPIDLSFSASTKGDWSLTATSLSDSSVRTLAGTNAFFRKDMDGLTRRVVLTAIGPEDAEVTVDNVLLSRSRLARKGKIDYEFRAAEVPEFDAKAAGWNLMFGDEFDGTAYDETKWTVPERIRKLAFVSNGIAYVQCDYKPGTTNLMTGYITSKESFGYGYYEARVRFTTYNGWWSAIFLYSGAVGNPFVDGMEIDVYEDYYMRNPSRNVLDHNLHAYGAGPLKSWNYTTKIPGSHKDWYTIGCLWTPFEISYYLDGKLMKSKSSHSPYDSATFDAFRHATTIMPLKIMFGGKPFRVAYGKHPYDPTEIMPEALEMDWIRVYRWPGSEEGASPTVTLRNADANRYSVPQGEMMKFTVDVQAAKSGARIKAVHLFDDGYHLMTKREPPYEFTFPLSDEFYKTTAWKRSGRAKEEHPFEGTLHAFAAFAEDEAGGIGHSPAQLVMLMPQKKSAPFRGTPQKLPGTIILGHYDEGGQGVAYYDTTPPNFFADRGNWRANEAVDAKEHCIGSVDTGEWLNYTVDVEKTGRYEFDVLIGSPIRREHKVNLVVDGKLAGAVTFGGHSYDDWRTESHVTTSVDLTAGRHVLTLHLFGKFNLGDIVVRAVE